MKKENTIKESYDSTRDADMHMHNIDNVFNYIIIPELLNRARNHDISKFESPERETYDKFIPLLRQEKYGTPKYQELRKQMAKEGLSHHYKVNRHHPEHFTNGVQGMNLIDLVEMICDWFAASLVSDTSFSEGIPMNAKRYNLSDDLVSIIENTFDDYFCDMEKFIKGKNESFEKDAKIRILEEFAYGRLTNAKVETQLNELERIKNENSDRH